MPQRADWAALVPYNGIQNLPASLQAIGEVEIPAGTVRVPLAKLTVAGSDGYMTFVNGVFDSSQYQAPT